MLKTLATLAVLTHPMFVTDQNLKLKALNALGDVPKFTRVCAIPLKDPSGPGPSRIDPGINPMSHVVEPPPFVPANFDKMAHPADVPACPQH